MSQQTIGRYVIERELGSGRLATVYLATDPNLERKVAVKLLGPILAKDAGFRERFAVESRALARLNHPAIVTIYDFGQHEDTFFLAMRYMPGGSLRARLDEVSALTLSVTNSVIQRVGSALHHAHQRSVLHGDVRPSNILFDEAGQAYLSNFRLLDLAPNDDNVMLATPAYLSPEKVLGSPADGRSDLYSLGIVLYEMLAGRVPFEGDSPADIAIGHVREPVPSLLEFRTDLPPEGQAFLEKALAKDPDDRFQTAEEMAQAWQGIVEQVDSTTAQSGTTFEQSAPADDAAAPALPDVLAASLNRQLRRGRLLPIIGDALGLEMLAPVDTLATAWAQRASYPGGEGSMTVVAQFASVMSDPLTAKEAYTSFLKDQLLTALDQDATFDRRLQQKLRGEEASQTLMEIAAAAGFPGDRAGPATTYRRLARMGLPVYITTSHSDFLEAALQQAGASPRSEVYRWHDGLYDVLPPGLDEEPDWTPSAEEPLVFHVFGREAYPSSMVLTEDDHFALLKRLAAEPDTLPTVVRQALAQSALLLLGYRFREWALRTVLHGLLDGSSRYRRRFSNVIVLAALEAETRSQVAAEEFFTGYFGDLDFEVYWGSAQEFLQALGQASATGKAAVTAEEPRDGGAEPPESRAEQA